MGALVMVPRPAAQARKVVSVPATVTASGVVKVTACSQTSRVRIHAVSEAGTVRPCAVLTRLDHFSSGRSRHSTLRCTAA